MSARTNTAEVAQPSDTANVREPAATPQRAVRLPFERASGLFVWLTFIVIFGLWVPDTFLTTATVKAIGGNEAITVVLALGVLFVLAAGEFDLSSAQNLGLSAVLAGALMVNSDMSPALAVTVTLLIGLLIGTVNGYLVAWVGVNSFIATLGMSSVLLAATGLISDNTFIGPVPRSLQKVANTEIVGLPIVLLYALIAALLAWYVLEHTPVGRRVHATGANTDAARLAGVQTRRYVLGAFVVSGGLASLAGVLVAAKIGSVSPQLGPPYLLPAYAACFLGATQIKPGRFNVWGTVMAIYLLATGVQGLGLVGGEVWVTDLFNGVALVGSVTVAVLLQKRRNARLRAASDRAVLASAPIAADTTAR